MQLNEIYKNTTKYSFLATRRLHFIKVLFETNYDGLLQKIIETISFIMYHIYIFNKSCLADKYSISHLRIPYIYTLCTQMSVNNLNINMYGLGLVCVSRAVCTYCGTYIML